MNRDKVVNATIKRKERCCIILEELKEIKSNDYLSKDCIEYVNSEIEKTTRTINYYNSVLEVLGHGDC